MSMSANTRVRKRLGDMLVEMGRLTEDDLRMALDRQRKARKPLGEILVSSGLVTQKDLLEALSLQLGVPYADLRTGLVDPKIVDVLPKQTASRYGICPMFKVHDALTVAVSRPLSIFEIDDIEQITSMRLQLVLCGADLVQQAVEKYYGAQVELDVFLDSLEESQVEVVEEDTYEDDLSKLEEMGDASPIVNLVNYILLSAVKEEASDIHIEPGETNVHVRIRIDGRLQELMSPRMDLHPAIISRVKVMGKMDIAQRRKPQDGRIQVQAEGRQIDVRVSTLPTVLGEKVVMRILDKRNVTFKLDDLGIRKQLLGTMREIFTRPHGLVLVTGPTGSGKSTTLYSALSMVRSPELNLVTIEDPVEYQVEMINQVQVHEAAGLTFASTLRTVLRQDPDIVMVGEIRDGETANTAVQAALTGHLVLSTLHTNDAVGAVTRLVNMGVEPFLISSSLVGVVAQRLLRKLCHGCRKRVKMNPGLRKKLGLTAKARATVYRSVGCDECFHRGYRGRTGIFEVFKVDETFREMISASASEEAMRKYLVKSGMSTLYDEGILRAREGVTSVEEALRLAVAD